MEGGHKVTTDENYIIHATLDADSVRKRMSVLVEGPVKESKTEKGEFDPVGPHCCLVICKGADNIVLDRCAASYDKDDTPPSKGAGPELKSYEEVFPQRPDDADVE